MCRHHSPSQSPARRSVPLALGFLLLALASLPAQGGDPAVGTADAGTGARLQWAEVAGARSYEVQARRKGESENLLSVVVESAGTELPLPPGEYEIRIIAYNVFRKVFSTSEWTDFTIIRTAELTSRDIEAIELYSGYTYSSITLTGSGFLPETKVRLAAADRTIEGAVKASTDGTSLSATFDLTGVPAGAYQLLIQNPGLAEQVYPSRLTVREPTIPRLDALSPLSFGNNRAYPAVRIEGGGFLPETLFILRGSGGNEIRHSRLVALDQTAATVVFNLADRPAGQYKLVARNPGGQEALLAETVTLVDVMGGELDPQLATQATAAGMDETETAEQSGLASQSGLEDTTSPAAGAELPASGDPSRDEGKANTQDAPDAPDATAALSRPRRLWAGAGYRPAFIALPAARLLYEDSLKGGELVLGLSLAPVFAPGSLVGLFGFELSVATRHFTARENPLFYESWLMPYTASTSLVFAWQPWLDGRLGIAARAGYGLSVSHLYRRNQNGEESLVSQDSALNAGVGLRWEPVRGLVLELGADWQAVFYVSLPAHLVQPYLRIGWWLY